MTDAKDKKYALAKKNSALTERRETYTTSCGLKRAGAYLMTRNTTGLALEKCCVLALRLYFTCNLY